MTLLNISLRETLELIKQYGGKSYSVQPLVKPRLKSFKYPSSCSPMGPQHRNYLESRDFDPDQIEHAWGVMGTGPVSTLDKKDYKHRLIIPIKWKEKVVSFQGRAISKKTKLRYKACPLDREEIPHQTILYGKQSQWTDIGICVEGVTDVWRLPSSTAIFGISFTPSQIRALVQYFTRVIILFDDDPQAQIQAEKLMGELRFRGVKVHKENIIGDPASMKQEDANKLAKELTRRIY